MLRAALNTYCPGGRHRIVDDRRKIVPLCTAADVPEGAGPDLEAAIHEGNRHRWGPFLAEFATLAALFTALSWFGHGLIRRDPAWYAALLALVAAALFVYNAVGSRAAGIRAVRACHAAGRCPSCCYDLTHIAAEMDGLTVCPECGGAWKRGNINEPRG